MAQYILQNTVIINTPQGSILFKAGRIVDEGKLDFPLQRFIDAGARLVPASDTDSANIAAIVRRYEDRGADPKSDANAQVPFAVDSGFRVASDTTARDAVFARDRREGMHVYVIATDTTYRLGPSLTNGDWVALSVGGAVGSAATLAALSALATTTTGALAYVATVKSYYQLDLNSTLTIDGITILATSAGGNTRWIRSGPPHPFWLAQAAWFIDPVAGNDENAGSTLLLAIKTHAELERRWGPKGVVTPTVVAITLAGNLPTTDPIKMDIFMGPVCGEITYTGTATTTVRSGSFTGVTTMNPATNQAWEVVDTGIASWSADIGKRVRVTSGPASGGKAWVAKAVAANTARMSNFTIVPVPPIISVSPVSPGIGASYVVEDLTTAYLGNIHIEVNTRSGFVPQVSFVDMNILSLISGDYLPPTSGWRVVYAGYGSKFSAVLATAPASLNSQIYANCHFAKSIACNGGIVAIDAGLTMDPGGFIGVSTSLTGSGGQISLDADHLVQGTSIRANENSVLFLSQVAVFDAQAFTVSPSGAGASVGTVGFGFFQSGGTLVAQISFYGAVRFWGAGNDGPGLEVGSFGHFGYEPGAALTATGAGGDFRVGEAALGLVVIDPATGAALPAIDQTWANLGAAMPGGFGGNVVNPKNNALLVSSAP